VNYIAQLAEGEFFILHPSSFILEVEARGGVEPRAFPPDALRFGLEDRCRERGPGDCRFLIADCRLVLLVNSALMRTLENDQRH